MRKSCAFAGFIMELWGNLGTGSRYSAGDIGVVGRRIGYMYGMYKKLHAKTRYIYGKGRSSEGSILASEARVMERLLCSQMLTRMVLYKGKTVAVSVLGMSLGQQKGYDWVLRS